MLYSDEELLTELRQRADGNIAPVVPDFNDRSDRGSATYHIRFGSWWKACVRAGLRPREKWPLTPTQYQQFRSAALARSSPVESIYALLVLIAGLPPRYVTEFSPSWCEHIDDSPYQPMITVPSEITVSGEPWTFRIPEYIHLDDEKVNTELPGLLRWYFNGHYDSAPSLRQVQMIIHRVANDMRPTERELTSTKRVGIHPLIRASDLRASTGVHLARRGARKTRIQNHLGIEHTNWKDEVEDFFLWNYVHEGIEHDQFDPPDTVLDPDSGNPQYP